MRLQPYRQKGRTSRTTVTTLNLHKPIVMSYVIKLRRTKSKVKFITKNGESKKHEPGRTQPIKCGVHTYVNKSREISPPNNSHLQLLFSF